MTCVQTAAGVIARSALSLAGALLLVACGSGGAPQRGASQTAVVKPAVPLPVSINPVMVGLVDHASHEILNAAKADGAPKDDQGWDEVEHHAVQLAAAGTLITFPGTGQPDEGWVTKPDWQMLAKRLSDAGMVAVSAAHSKDVAAISKAGDQIVEICE